MTAGQFLETPLHQWHVDNGGRMVDFAGWSMPVQYASIVAEHHHTRKKLGLFDVSHMGRLFFSGSDVDQFLDSLSTRRIVGVVPGKVRYSLICNDDGKILDDVLIYHLAAGEGFPAGDDSGNSFYMMVCNASNRAKIVKWFSDHVPADSNIKIDDRTETTAMIAVQGPEANAVVAKLASSDPETLAYYCGTVCKVDGGDAIVSRTGYTGEDGCAAVCIKLKATWPVSRPWARSFSADRPLRETLDPAPHFAVARTLFRARNATLAPMDRRT